jgi:glutamate formiminotransferase
VTLLCVVNVSEGRDDAWLDEADAVCGVDLLDRHHDPFHHRAVFTVVGTVAPRALTRLAVATLDLRRHAGAHPRLGVVDVVPFVPLAETGMADALAARDAFAAWASAALDVPCFLYGPERSLPEVRRQAFTALVPDVGPPTPHPTAGAISVGARPPLVAYNLWLAEPDLPAARRVAAAVRGPSVRALAMACGPDVQVSLNLLEPSVVGPAEAYDAVAAMAAIARAELVGLLAVAVLDRITPSRWRQLDLSPSRTVECRLAAR